MSVENHENDAKNANPDLDLNPRFSARKSRRAQDKPRNHQQYVDPSNDQSASDSAFFSQRDESADLEIEPDDSHRAFQSSLTDQYDVLRGKNADLANQMRSKYAEEAPNLSADLTDPTPSGRNHISARESREPRQRQSRERKSARRSSSRDSSVNNARRARDAQETRDSHLRDRRQLSKPHSREQRKHISKSDSHPEYEQLSRNTIPPFYGRIMLPLLQLPRKWWFALGGIFLVLLLCCLTTLFYVQKSNTVADYSGPPGKEVLVNLHGSTLSDFAITLEQQKIIAHAQLFINVMHERPLSDGFYILPEHISSFQAAKLLLSRSTQTAQITIPPGVTVLDHFNNAGKIVPGILSLIAQASCITLNKSTTCYTSVPALMDAAKNASPEQLHVPAWALPAVRSLKNDPRRLEGLIAAGTWDTISPQATPVEKLRELIDLSTQFYDRIGLYKSSVATTGLNENPYQKLIIASIVERESSKAADDGKIARVIYNRLESRPPMRLDMDSTINYFFGHSDFDFTQNRLHDNNPWNTRIHSGLPITPIGSVSVDAIKDVLNPPLGPWKYFVTIDNKGTTLFSDTYQKQQQNQAIACRNHFLRC